MSDLVVIAYRDLATAQRAADTTRRLQDEHSIHLDDLVVIERQAGGRIELHQPSRARDGAKTGARHGTLIGLLFFAPLFGAIIGSAAGAARGVLSDHGLDAGFMRALGQELQPGGAALILLVRDASLDAVLSGIDAAGTVLRTTLDPATESRLSAALAAA